MARASQLGEGFADLFSLDAADEILSERGLRTPFIRVVKDGAIVDSSRYTGTGGVGAMVNDQVIDDGILELFASGHTVVLQGLHRFWPPLIDFAGALGSELGHPVQINAYITPQASQGFAAHYDVHDVFVLQIAGAKKWILHDSVHPEPLRNQPWTQHRSAVLSRAEETPLSDDVLEAGDVLYVPRGYIHSAEALGDISIHLTLGVQAYTRYDILEALVDIAADDRLLRQALPLGTDIVDPEELRGEVAATIAALTGRMGSISANDVCWTLERRTRGVSRAAPLWPLAQALALSRLEGDTLISRRAHMRMAIIEDGDSLRLELPGRSTRFPAVARRALERLLDVSDPLRVVDLPGLSEEEAVEVVGELLRVGAVVPAAEP
jgi:lysine-specific demethylase/histidyl-hydroxylase NO66